MSRRHVTVSEIGPRQSRDGAAPHEPHVAFDFCTHQFKAPPGGVLVSFETYAHVKNDVRCEERGHVQVKSIAQPVATYAVIGRAENAEQAGTAHLRLEVDADRMSGEERKAAADVLRRALGLLEKSGPG